MTIGPRPSRAQSRARARRINDLCLTGSTPDEIAAEVGITIGALWKLRRRWGHPIAARKGARRIFAWISDPSVTALDRYAAEIGVDDRTRALGALVNGIFSTDPAAARREWARARRAQQETPNV